MENTRGAVVARCPRSAALLLMFLFPLAAKAQTDAPPESVEVLGNDLVGIWRVDFPSWGRINIGGVRLGALQGNFCRVEQMKAGLTANCFPRPGRDGIVDVEGKHFHMAWGSMMARLYVDGEMSSRSEFAGHFGFRVTGIAFESPSVSRGEKLTLSVSAPDSGGKASVLTRALRELGEGQSISGIDAKSGFVHLPNAANVRQLGNIAAVVYLGILPKPRPPESRDAPQPDFYRVYDVEFDNGHRLCGLHQRDDGMVDAFGCV